MSTPTINENGFHANTSADIDRFLASLPGMLAERAARTVVAPLTVDELHRLEDALLEMVGGLIDVASICAGFNQLRAELKENNQR